uniref:Secreted protein n=1 Tax=Angiostrongylus cantonensis TaxID=6313 RepID=A0A0K0CVZ5_ANGCA
MLARERRRLSKPMLINIFLIVDVRFGLFVVRVNGHGQTRVDEEVNADESSTVACFQEQFCSNVIDAVEWVGSSRLGQANDVVPYHSCLHEQVFCRGLGCNCTCIVGTDRHHSSS